MQISRQSELNLYIQFLAKIVLCRHRMTLEVDGLSDPHTQGPPTTKGGDHHWWAISSLVNNLVISAQLKVALLEELKVYLL